MSVPMPDLADVSLAYPPASYWLAGDYDPIALIETLKDQPGLADFTDTRGNQQSAVRLDPDQAGLKGFWVTVPAIVPRATIDAAASAYLPPVPAVSTAPVAERVADALRPIAAKPAGTPVTSDELVAVINALTS